MADPVPTGPAAVNTVASDSAPGAQPLPEGRSTDAWDRSGRIATAVIASAWVVMGVLALSRPVFISHDSLSNNVHVWWIAEQLWGGNGVPMHIAPLANGEALTFPYASVPWLTSALVWPLLGDRAVTLWLVLGMVATVAATFWTFPTLRRGWWAAATLANPSLVISPLLGQLPFLWAVACCLLAMGSWHRGRTAAAVVLAVLAQVIHPAVVMPIVAVVVLLWLPFERPERRKPLVGWWLLSAVVSLPAAWAVFQSPVVAQTSMATQVGALFQTVAMRLLVVLVPMVLVGLQMQRRRPLPVWAPAALTGVFLVLQVPMFVPFGMDYAWGSLVRNPPATIDRFADSDGVREGDTYRVLSAFDGKYGLYAVARAGGVLDAEFFPEGLHRGGFASVDQYAAFLRQRQVDHVVAFDNYTDRYTRSNEPELLRRMADEGCVGGVRITRVPGGDGWSLYDVERGC
ncbi:MAG: hypothetical protein ACOYOP_12885 [Microthrixaceae bacterium]